MKIVILKCQSVKGVIPSIKEKISNIWLWESVISCKDTNNGSVLFAAISFALSHFSLPKLSGVKKSGQGKKRRKKNSLISTLPPKTIKSDFVYRWVSSIQFPSHCQVRSFLPLFSHYISKFQDGITFYDLSLG